MDIGSFNSCEIVVIVLYASGIRLAISVVVISARIEVYWHLLAGDDKFYIISDFIFLSTCMA